MLCLALIFSFSTSVFADSKDEELQNATLHTDANTPEKIKEALSKENALVEVNAENPVAQHYFEDGSFIELSMNVNNDSLNRLSVMVETRKSASVDLSGYSWVGGDLILLWTYTMEQDYKTNGTKVTWYNSVPYTSFHSPIWSLWGLDSESVGVSSNPDDSNGIYTTSTIKCSFGIWELHPDTASAKLIINIKGDGSYTTSAYFI